jgi:hypothetical protein
MSVSFMEDHPKARSAAWFFAGMICFWCLHWIHAKRSETQPPSNRAARELLNDCQGFTNVGPNTRRVVSVSDIHQSHDSGINTFVTYDWQWTSGNLANSTTSHRSSSGFYYSRDDHQWSVYDIPDGEGRSGSRRGEDICSKLND